MLACRSWVCGVLVCWGVLAASGAARAGVVYSNDFETSAGAEWSSSARQITPKGARRFLGRFNNQEVTLHLDNLPAHTGLRVSFDLYVIQYWTGNGTYYGPHLWEFGLAGAPPLLHTTFSNGDQPQAYPGDYPEVNNPPYTGAAEVNTLGYPQPGDSVYHITRTIYNSAPSVTFRFAGSHLQGLPVTDWGLDNVTVETVAAPKPAPSTANRVVNGDFETPIVPSQDLITVHAPSSDIAGWTVSDGSVDLNGEYWQNAAGRQSLDMSGQDQAGTIYQDIPTEPGKAYRLSFSMAGNPGGQPVKYLEVWWGDTRVDTATFDATGKSNRDMGWVRKSYYVTTPTQAASTTRLKFVSLNNDSFGPALDLVSVVPAYPGDLVTNGEFEDPAVATGRTTYGTYESFGGWTVLDGSVQQVGSDWQAAGGKTSVHLNGSEPGSIQQSVPTVSGETYLLRFSMAGDPEGSAGVRTMDVLWGNRTVAAVSFFMNMLSPQAMGWRENAMLLPGTTSGLTSLEFLSTTPGTHGPAVDSVSVVPAVAGDADQDGVVTVADAMAALRAVYTLTAPDPVVHALSDVAPWAGVDGRLHGDGKLDMADVRAILGVAGGLAA